VAEAGLHHSQTGADIVIIAQQRLDPLLEIFARGSQLDRLCSTCEQLYAQFFFKGVYMAAQDRLSYVQTLGRKAEIQIFR